MNEEKFVEEINDIGFTLWEGRFDPECIEELNKWAEENYPPERGHDKNMKWFGWETVKDMTPEEIAEVDWAYYWTDEPKGNHFIDNIIKPDLGKAADAAFGAGILAMQAYQKAKRMEAKLLPKSQIQKVYSANPEAADFYRQRHQSFRQQRETYHPIA